MILTKYIVLATVFKVCATYKILLFFSVPSKSHRLLGEGYVRHLLDAGHNVTYISPLQLSIQNPNLRQIVVSESIKWYPPADFFSVEKIISQELALLEYIPVMNSQYRFTKNTLLLEEVQDLMMDPNENFDAVIVEWAYNDLGAGLSAVFECPLIWSSSHSPHTLVLSLIDEHLNPAYTFHVHSKYRSFTFIERVRQLWQVIKARLYLWLHKREHEAMYQSAFQPAIAKRGRNAPSYDAVRYNGSLVLGNGNVVSSDPFPLPKNYKDIGGYHIFNTTKTMSQIFQEIMANASKGVIYFSLGSILKVSSMPRNLQLAILDVLSNTERTVIWNSDVKFSNTPQNVHIVNYAPQLDILAHPNCVLFVTHAGLLSITEALSYGVPVIGIPFFADQYNNINKVVDLGFGKQAYLDLDSAGNLRKVMTEVLENPTYRQRARELSEIYQHKLTTPGKELVYWVDHVIRSRGAPHLRSNSMKVEWYKKLYLDLLGVVISAIAAIIIILKSILRIRKTIDVKIKTK